jgi:hypothetical protein
MILLPLLPGVCIFLLRAVCMHASTSRLLPAASPGIPLLIPRPLPAPYHRPPARLQVMQAEADEKAGKAIQRYISRAFNDATGEPTADSNPLLRRNHKLSATNPLL